MVPPVVSSRWLFAVAEGGSVFSRQPWGHGSETLLLWHRLVIVLLWVRLKSALSCPRTAYPGQLTAW